jgi:effector-binding domain-containing protein
MSTAAATRYNVTLRSIEPVRVAAIHGLVPGIEKLGDTFDRLFEALEGYVGRHGRAAGPHIAIYHDSGTGPRMVDMSVELAIPFEGSAVSDGEVRVYHLPRVDEMVCVVHRGPFERIGHAYDALLDWVEQNGYRLAGPSREVYLDCGEGDSSRYTTEVQFPVAR